MLFYRRSRVLRLITMAGPGLIPAAMVLSFEPTDTYHVARTALEGLIYSLTISSLCWLILPRMAGRVMRQSRAGKWAMLLSVLLAICVVGCLIAATILLVIGVSSKQDFIPDAVISLKISFVLAMVFGATSFFHEVVLGRLNAATKDAERSRQMATEARLSSLESRIHPHFLFNTLNSISALIREDPAQAERTVERLASLLRFSLEANATHLVSLQLELKIVRDYLAIEQTRFGARLRFTIDVPDEMLAVEIPPMSVQTLVENSVKHAVSTQRDGATIEIRARMVDAAPAIDVIDDGPGFDMADVKKGHGLDLLQSRLAALLGPRASLELASEPGRMRATVVLM